MRYCDLIRGVSDDGDGYGDNGHNILSGGGS